MTIIFVNRFFFPDHSATSQLASDLVFALAPDQAVAVITSCLRYDDPDARLPGREIVDGVKIYRIPTTRFGRTGGWGRAFDFISFHIAAWLALIRIVGPGDIIVAKTDPPLLSIFALCAARLKGAVLVNWMQDIYPEIASVIGVPGLKGPIGQLLIRLRNASLTHAKANVVLGDLMAERLRGFGVPAARIQVIPNWTHEQAITPIDAKSNPLRAAWGLEGKFVVAYSGNLGAAHEYETMLAAAASLADDPTIVFLMIGGGSNFAALRAAADRATLRNIQFQPYQDQSDLALSLSVGDIHWISLRPDLEGLVFPSKVYGVLAVGRPIIAVTARTGEVARLVEQHGCGVQVDPGDHSGFARALRALTSDPDQMLRFGVAARRAATDVFSRHHSHALWRKTLRDAARALKPG